MPENRRPDQSQPNLLARVQDLEAKLLDQGVLLQRLSMIAEKQEQAGASEHLAFQSELAAIQAAQAPTAETSTAAESALTAIRNRMDSLAYQLDTLNYTLRSDPTMSSVFYSPGFQVAGESVTSGTIPSARVTTVGTTGGAISFYGATAVARPSRGGNVTNNVAAGGSANVIDDVTDGTTYATDYATIRANFYRIAQILKDINDGLRTLGLLS